MSFSPEAFERFPFDIASSLDFLNGCSCSGAVSFAFYTQRRGAEGPDLVTISREGSLDSHLVFSKRCADKDDCLASCLISFVYTILIWILLWPCRAETRSHKIAAQSTNHHEAKYKQVYVPSIIIVITTTTTTSSPTLLPLFGTFPSIQTVAAIERDHTFRHLLFKREHFEIFSCPRFAA